MKQNVWYILETVANCEVFYFILNIQNKKLCIKIKTKTIKKLKPSIQVKLHADMKSQFMKNE